MEEKAADLANTISSFLQEGRRNKLVLTKSLCFIRVRGVDIGYELSSRLMKRQHSKHLPAFAEEAFRNILESSQYQSDRFGVCVGLTNLGILFEPELRINVLKAFEVYSQNHALFIEWLGEKDGDDFFFLSREKGSALSLKDLSYLSI